MERKRSVIERLEHAFNTAEQHLGIDRLLDPEGNQHPLYLSHTHTQTLVILGKNIQDELPSSLYVNRSNYAPVTGPSKQWIRQSFTVAMAIMLLTLLEGPGQ